MHRHLVVRFIATLLMIIGLLIIVAGALAAWSISSGGFGAGWGPGRRDWLPGAVILVALLPALIFLAFGGGSSVEVELYRSPDLIRQTIVAIGSHDLTLDLLAEEIGRRYPGRSLSSANVGSLGGLLALARCEAHLAGSHLLDEETGEYNVSYIKRILPSTRVALLGFVEREQGLIVPKGNPRAISSLADLTRPGLVFINRQRGAGTRVLFDYRLRQLGIDPIAIEGYNRQEFTHLGVAAAVASGAADAGMGILAAARALELDFVPLDVERYDLVIPWQYYEPRDESPSLAPLLEIVRDSAFAERVRALGGYRTPHMGELLAEII